MAKTAEQRGCLFGFLFVAVPAVGLAIFTFTRPCAPEMPGLGRGLAMWTIIAGVIGGVIVGAIGAAIGNHIDRKGGEPGPLECGKCGYSLVGLTSDKCPECGEPLS